MRAQRRREGLLEQPRTSFRVEDLTDKASFSLSGLVSNLANNKIDWPCREFSSQHCSSASPVSLSVHLSAGENQPGKFHRKGNLKTGLCQTPLRTSGK